MALSTLASRLGLHFVWSEVSRDVLQTSAKDRVQEVAPAVGKTDLHDLLFHGRHTKGILFSKLKGRRALKLSKGFEQAATAAELVFDMVFKLPLSHPVVVGDGEMRWTDEHPQLKGSLSVLVDCGTLQDILPKATLFGTEKKLSVVALVIKRSKAPSQGTLVVDTSQPEKMAHLQALHRAGDEVLAVSRSDPRRYNKDGHISWGETLDLGEVPLERPEGEDTLGCLWLQLVVCQGSGAEPVELLGAAEQSLLGLVQSGWKDQKVKVSMEKADAKKE